MVRTAINALAAGFCVMVVAAPMAPANAQDAGGGCCETSAGDRRATRFDDGRTHRGPRGTTFTTGGYRAPPNDSVPPVGPLLSIDPRFTGDLPACDTPYAFDVIRFRFAEKESRFWNSSLKIMDIDRIRTVATNPWGPNTIPRRYCSARAQMSDGRYRVVDYWLAEGQSIVSWSYGVEFCVRGLDRGWSHAPDCRMVRP
ncbi:MAG: hypothetical protein WCH83_05755 [Alphaproteobacteria bacterium]